MTLVLPVSFLALVTVRPNVVVEKCRDGEGVATLLPIAALAVPLPG